MDKLKIDKNIILYLLTIALFAVFYYFLPFAGDDWAWGSDVGMDRLKNCFDGYNGRYLGNILIICVTRSVAFKVLFCSLTVFAVIFTLSKIFDNLSNRKNSTANYIVAFSSVLLLVLPNQIAFNGISPFQIFGSTIGWLSGFTNYVVPSVFVLVFYNLVTSKKYNGKAVCAVSFLCGFFACLCVEHYTLFCLLFGAGAVAYRYYTCKKICKKSLSFLLGSAVGSAIMFSNSSYRLMQKGDVSNNQRAVGFFGSLKNYCSYIFGANASKTLVVLFEVVLLALITAFIVFFIRKMYRAVANKKIASLLPVVCMVFMTLPLLFTNSGKEIYIVAPRCYFLQYFMLVIYLYGKIVRGKGFLNKAVPSAIKRANTACLAFLLLITAVNYAMLGYMGAVRDNVADELLKNPACDTVEVIKYPQYIESVQWSSNFIKDSTYLDRYKKFKKIPASKSAKAVEYNSSIHKLKN